jgi:hypothetical protein
VVVGAGSSEGDGFEELGREWEGVSEVGVAVKFGVGVKSL